MEPEAAAQMATLLKQMQVGAAQPEVELWSRCGHAVAMLCVVAYFLRWAGKCGLAGGWAVQWSGC